MANKDKQAVDEPEEGEQEAAQKQDFIKKLLGNKKLLMIAGGGLLLLLLGIGAGVFFLFSGSGGGDQTEIAAAPPLPATPPQIVFYDVPDLIVNIQTVDGTPTYLKLSVTLELDSPDEKAGMQALMPRIVDQFQGYLRELRMDDIKGSAGIVRLKEELQRRVNVAAAPYRVREVLFKEMIIQ